MAVFYICITLRYLYRSLYNLSVNYSFACNCLNSKSNWSSKSSAMSSALIK